MPKFLQKSGSDLFELRKLPVKEFLDKDCGSMEVMTVTTESSPEEVLKKLMDPTNREDAVVVISHKSSPTVGVITQSDFLNWTRKFMFPSPKSDYNEMDAVLIANPNFFYIKEDEPLEKAIELMKENKTSHIVVLDNSENKNFVGWVTRRSILRTLGSKLL